MNKKLKNALSAFFMHFDYSPELPPEVDFDQNAYAEELLKCVADDFDYTVEKYGTRIPDFSKRGTTIIYID